MINRIRILHNLLIQIKLQMKVKGGFYMKKSITRITFLTLIIILILVSILGCQKEEINETVDDTYRNEKGFTFEIPEVWKEKKEKVKIIEEDRSVTFAYIFDPNGEEYHQNFFTIAIMSEKEYEEELNDPPVVSNLISKKDGQVYLLYTPLDNIILEKESIEEYSEMNLSLEEIIERFSLLDSDEEVKTELGDYYFEPSISTIEGTLITRMHYGPPNYGENPDTDEKLYPFILELDEAINIIALEDDVNNSDKFGVTEIQLAATKEQIEELKEYKNKRIKIQGTLFEALVGRHFTDVLIDVDEIEN